MLVSVYKVLSLLGIFGMTFAYSQQAPTALVTGSAGFLGSHMCEYLLAQGYQVIGVDNFYTGDKQNLASIQDHPNFSFILHDIIEPLNVKTPIDEIYNFACPASPLHYQKDPIYTLKISVLGALNLLNLAREHQAKIFQSSTSEVYGDPEEHPQSEAYWGHVNPIGIRSCYDEGKRCAETLFFDYHRQHKVKIKVGRIFNTYGPRMGTGDGRVVPNFVMQALCNKPITIFGKGEQTRSFCYVSDLIKGIYKLMQSEDAIIGPINIGNPHEFTMLELASKVIEKTGSKSSFIYQELPSDDPQRRKPDISLASEKLHWAPQIELDEGIEKTVEYFRLQNQF